MVGDPARIELVDNEPVITTGKKAAATGANRSEEHSLVAAGFIVFAPFVSSVSKHDV